MIMGTEENSNTTKRSSRSRLIILVLLLVFALGGGLLVQRQIQRSSASARIFELLEVKDLAGLASAIDDGANVNIRNERGYTPLHVVSATSYDPEFIRVLLRGKADVNAKDKDKGMTALHWAAWGCRKKIISILLEAGADKDAKDNRGRTPLDLAPSDEIKALLK